MTYPRRSKYNAKITEVDGILFASQAEARRYGELKLLEQAGEISGLQLQPSYPLVVNGMKIATYRADFLYRDREGKQIVEDTKGFRTAVYRIKRKLMVVLYGIEIVETS